MKQWAKENGYEKLYEEYLTACEVIAEECESEGYPAHGSNYDLRIERLQNDFQELFA